jgi:hypothetical protein
VTVVRGYYCPSGCKPSEPHQGSGTAEPAVLFDEDGAATAVVTEPTYVPKVGDRVILGAWEGEAAGLTLLRGGRMETSVGLTALVVRVDTDGTALVEGEHGQIWWPITAMRPTSEPVEVET